jgi:hypothetical protein
MGTGPTRVRHAIKCNAPKDTAIRVCKLNGIEQLDELISTIKEA